MISTMLTLWINSGYKGWPSSNFSGGFQRLTVEDCYSNELPGCELTLPKDDTYSLLLGDSEAISISDLFKEEMGHNSYVSALTACSFIPKSIIRQNMSEDCQRLNSRNREIVFGSTCKKIYIFNRFRAESESEESSYFDFLKGIANSCEQLTVIGTPIELIPRFNAYSNLMAKTAVNSPKVFDRDNFDNMSFRWNQTLVDFFEGHNISNMRYINTNSIVIPEWPTTLINLDGEYLYTDSTHLSKYGGEMVMAEIKRNVS
jgi:hypothetical protein